MKSLWWNNKCGNWVEKAWIGWNGLKYVWIGWNRIEKAGIYLTLPYLTSLLLPEFGTDLLSTCLFSNEQSDIVFVLYCILSLVFTSLLRWLFVCWGFLCLLYLLHSPLWRVKGSVCKVQYCEALFSIVKQRSVRNLQSAVCCVQCEVFTMQCAVCRMRIAVWSVLCALFIV